MEDKRIKAVKNWPELRSVRDIQVFIQFTNFYQRFIQGFSKIAASFISILKTSASQPNTIANKLDDSGGTAGGCTNVDSFGFGSNEKSSKLRKLSGNSGATEEPKFLTSDAREVFNLLWQAFTKAPILRHFDLERYIRIETNASGYTIGRVLNQLILDYLTSDSAPISTKSDFGQWHPVTYISRKIIPVETRYKIYNSELLAIVEAFKTWRHYLEGCKYKVLVLTDYNNLCRFMDTKNLSSRQVCWAQELSHYYFQINYRQGKENATADVLSCYF